MTRINVNFYSPGLEEPGWGKGLDEMAAFYGERAKGEVGLIVTGGIAPNTAGQTLIGAAKMASNNEANAHKVVTDEVHRNGGLIAMQILHTGRYAYHFSPVSASPIKSPISWYKLLSLLYTTCLRYTCIRHGNFIFVFE